MIWLVTVLLAVCAFFVGRWSKKDKWVKLDGLVTANYVALNRLNKAIERHEDGQWKFYSEPQIVYLPREGKAE